MKIYLGGPMRGHKLYNFPAFFKAAMELRKQGHTVVNPAEIDMALGLNPAIPVDDEDQIPFDIQDILRNDFQEVLKADAIVLLPGWEDSSGAKDERHIALRTGRKVYYWNIPLQFMQESKVEDLSEIDLCQDDRTGGFFVTPRLWASLPGVKSLRLSLIDSAAGEATVRVDVVDSETGEMLYDFGNLLLENSNHQVVIKLDAEVEVDDAVEQVMDKHSEVLRGLS